MPKTATKSEYGDLSLQQLNTRIDEVRDELGLLGSLLDYAAHDCNREDWAFPPSAVGALAASLIRLTDDLDELHNDVANASPETVRR